MNAFEWSKAYFQNEDRSLHETKATMAALMTYANFDTLECFPSQRTLARVTGTHVDTVRRHIRKNVDAGWLKVVEPGSSYKKPNRYRLTVPTPRTAAGSSSRTDIHQPPARQRGVKPTPRTGTGSTPRTDAGSTPRMDARLTTKKNHSRNHSESGSRSKSPDDPFKGSSDPFNGSGAITFPANHTEAPTPRTGAGSSPAQTRGGTTRSRSGGSQAAKTRSLGRQGSRCPTTTTPTTRLGL